VLQTNAKQRHSFVSAAGTEYTSLIHEAEESINYPLLI